MSEEQETKYIREFFDKITIAEPDFMPQEDVAAYILAQELAKLKVRVDELENKTKDKLNFISNDDIIAEIGLHDGLPETCGCTKCKAKREK